MAASGEINYSMTIEAAAEIVLQKAEMLLSRRVLVGCLANEALLNAKEKLATIREFFSARDRTSESPELMRKLLRALYDAEEFIYKFFFKVARGRHEALHVATRPLAMLVYKCTLLRDLSNLVKSMEEFCQKPYLEGMNSLDGGRKGRPASFDPWEGVKLARLTLFWNQRASTDFVCYETEKQQITKWISRKATCVPRISIFGKQGTGKTFLARRVYKEVMNLGFDLRAWVHLSAGMDKQEFLLEILKQLDKLARDSMNFKEIKEMLSQKLSKTNRFLIVLDDVRQPNHQLLQELLDIIEIPSRGHIITTTQDDTIARIMGTRKPKLINLDKSCTEESRKMIEFHRVSDVPCIPPKKDKILTRCPALPLCVSLLMGLEEHECRVLENESSVMSVSDVLLLSYHRLPVHLKPCFIYMALFPVASPISTRRLVRLWLAEGLLDSHCYDRELKRTPEDLGETFILELADRKVIDVVSWRADGSPKACQMLTSLYDLICPTMMSTDFLYVHKASNYRNPTGQQQQAAPDSAKVRWLAEHTNIFRDGLKHSYCDLNLSHIRSFLLFYPSRGMLTNDISALLRNTTSMADCSFLQVLDLEGVYKPSLRGVLRRLVLLRYLGLRSTVLESIPSEVAHLHYLETLDMKHTNISSLPSPLWRKRNLRHLYFNWFYIDLLEILKACSDNVMALTQLQTLSGLIIDELKEDLMRDLRYSLITLTTLTTLKLFLRRSGGDSSDISGKVVADWISFVLTNLQSLTFGVIQEAKPANKAQAVEETPPPKEAPKEGEAQSPEGAMKEEDKPTEEAKPTTSQISQLPGLWLARHHKLLELYLLGQLKEPVIWTQLLPSSLRVLTLSGSMVRRDMMPELGCLLIYLRTFRLLANSFQGTRLTFTKEGFPSLLILKIWKLPHLEDVIIEQGAMPRLKELDFKRLDMMGNVLGIDGCKKLETIRVVVKEGAHRFVDHLKKTKGKMTKLYSRIETDKPEFTKDDDSHDYDNDYEYEDKSNDHEGEEEEEEDEDED